MPVGDEAVRAFRKFARICPNADSLAYFDLCTRLRGSCHSEREALRLLAVYDMLRFLEAEGKNETVDAVKAIYFSCHGRTPRKNEITYRVRGFSLESSMDERTVWRRLEEAKALYLKLVSKIGD